MRIIDRIKFREKVIKEVKKEIGNMERKINMSNKTGKNDVRENRIFIFRYIINIITRHNIKIYINYLFKLYK